MKQLTEKEANEILTKLFELRNKCKRSRSKKLKAEYDQYEAFCEEKFDYLVQSKVYKYKNFSNYEDLKQDGRVALLLALRNFDPNKGSFFWWADKYIKTKVKREANRHSTIKIPIKQTKNIQPYKVSQLPVIIDTNPDPFQSIESTQLKNEVQKAIKQLPEDQRKIIELNGIKSYSISRISRELKITRPDCVKLLNEAKKNLKHSLESLNL